MISMTPEAITARIAAASAASDLSTDRLETKVDMSPTAVSARLREAADLLAACLLLRAEPR